MVTELQMMPTDRLPAWIEAVRRDYEQSRVHSGDSIEVAAQKARASIDTSFPGGVVAPGHLVYDVVAIDDEDDGNGSGDVVVGYLWISRKDDEEDAWWVSDIKIDEQYRGEGYGRAAMLLAETAAAEHGGVTLGLNVFGYNTAARALYGSLGYETAAVQMRKPLTR